MLKDNLQTTAETIVLICLLQLNYWKSEVRSGLGRLCKDNNKISYICLKDIKGRVQEILPKIPPCYLISLKCLHVCWVNVFRATAIIMQSF